MSGCLQGQLEANKKRRRKLLDGYISGLIPAELYAQKEKELIDEKLTLEAQMQGVNFDDDFIFEQIKQFFHIAASAGQLYRQGDVEAKRKLLSLIPSNLVMTDRHIASYQLKEPFNLLAEEPFLADFAALLGEKDSPLGA